MNIAKRSVNAGTRDMNEAGGIGRALSMKNDTKRKAVKVHTFIPLVPPSISEALVKTCSVSNTVLGTR